MLRKLIQLVITTCLAGALAPGLASADPTLTAKSNPGVPIAEGSTIKGTSINAETTGSPLGTLLCDHVLITAEVTENAGEGAAAVGVGGETDGCLAEPGERSLTVTNPTLIELKSTESGKATLSMTFTADVGPVECHYLGSGAVTYTTGSDLLKVSGLVLEATSPLCESEEPEEIEFSGSFTMTTSGGDPVRVSDYAPPPPPEGPVLTSADDPGEPVPVGSDVVGTSSNAKTTGTPLGELTCGNVTIFGEVTKNTGSSVAAVGTGGGTKVCLAQPGNRKLTVTNPTLVELKSTESGKATLSMTFTADVGPVECHYLGTGPATYTTGSDLLKVSGILLQATNPLCESEEPGEITFSGDFTMTTSDGGPVRVSDNLPPPPGSPVLTSTDDPGEPVPVGSDVVGTSENAETVGTTLGAMTCGELRIFGIITENTGSSVAAVGTGGETEDCWAEPGHRLLIVTDPSLVSLKTSESGKATLSMTYTADVGPIECHFTGTGPATYAIDSDLLEVAGITLESTSPLCESEEPGEILFSGDFTLTTDDGTPLSISD